MRRQGRPWDKRTPSRQPGAELWVGWASRGTGAWVFLTFVEESHAGASLGLTQSQHFCDHLCQTAGQLGVKGQRGRLRGEQMEARRAAGGEVM